MSQQGKFESHLSQGKAKLVRVSGEFELTEFELAGLYCIIKKSFTRSALEKIPDISFHCKLVPVQYLASSHPSNSHMEDYAMYGPTLALTKRIRGSENEIKVG